MTIFTSLLPWGALNAENGGGFSLELHSREQLLLPIDSVPVWVEWGVNHLWEKTQGNSRPSNSYYDQGWGGAEATHTQFSLPTTI